MNWPILRKVRWLTTIFALAVLTTVTLSAAPSFAQAPGVEKRDIVRFTRTLSQVAGARGVSIWLHRKREASGWQLRLVDRTAGKAVGVTKLPEWAGADYYGYDVTVRGFGNVIVLIFEAAPAPGVDAPPAAESFQIAWAYGVRRGEKKPVWIEVASTRNSTLDGGDRLVIRNEGGRDRLVRLRTSEQTRFCGADLAAYQIFNPSEISFKSKLDLNALVKDAPTLKARLPEDDFTDLRYPTFALWYSATSDRYNSDDSRTVIRPLEVGDGETDTAWIEGAAGLGRGEFVTGRINDALKMRGLRISAGHLGSEEEYAAFAKPRRVLITLEDGSRYAADIPPAPYRVVAKRGGHVVWFPRPVRSSCLSVVVLDAVDGSPTEADDTWKRSAVAISELAPVSELHGLAPDVAALVVVEKLLKEEDFRKSRRLVQLTSPLAKELVAVLNSVLESGSDEDRVRVVPLLRSLPSEASVPVLVRMFEDSHPSEKAYMMLKPAIATHRELAAKELVEILEERPPKNERKYTDLTRLIGRLGGPEQLHLLLGHLGEGSVRVRQERVRAVSAGRETMLSPLFQIAADHVDEPRGEDALLAINSIGRKLYFRGQGTHEGSGRLLDVADDARLRRTILLTMKALGFFAIEGGIDLLADFAGNAPDPLLRKQAVDAIYRYPSRDARAVLEAALIDSSPDVRIAAISGIGQREDRRQALPHIQRYVQRETWTPGLEVAYTILAELGDEKLVAELATTIAQSPDTDRAAIAAEALTRAKRTLPPSIAERLIYAPETSLVMRRNLVDSLGVGDDDRADDILMGIIAKPKPVAELKPRENERLRERAVLALGRRDSATARETLLDIVGDGGASNDMRAVALRGLAFSRERAVIPQLKLLRENAPQELRVAFDSTIDTVDRRADIVELTDSIEEVEQRTKNSVEPEEPPSPE